MILGEKGSGLIGIGVKCFEQKMKYNILKLIEVINISQIGIINKDNSESTGYYRVL